jgi:glutamyl-tRNA(Gln) amidotransferase subunit E
MDYKEIGLTVGIEIHQELDTNHKLFCSCPPKLNKGEPDFTFKRKLRPSQSELGEIDPAALFEFMKGKTIIYQANHDSICLVEMDEEPPGPLDPKALDVALIFSMMCNASPVDEVQVMRKTVVDGSNTGGFQRTSVISLGGSIEVDGKKYNLEQVAIEEDAARKIDEKGNEITYRLDRLGIPLIEITTAPEMHSPKETKSVAARIGALLRATKMVKRGIGTIRQDVNVSIMKGSIIEIKGVQDLSLLDTVVEYEAQRQLNLNKIAEELSNRNIDVREMRKETVDVSEIFKNTGSRILKNAISKGGKIYGVKLNGFKGLTGKELCPGRRLGTEFSDHAKYGGGVRGIFHTDELPGYSITSEEVEGLLNLIGAGENDVVVIVADEEKKCILALDAVLERARQAFYGVPEETRSANPDGTTRYTRPRPGAARMYPETDVKPVLISQDRLRRLEFLIPEKPEVKLERIQSIYNLNEKLASQIVDSDYVELFEDLAAQNIDPTLLAVTLTEDLTMIRREGLPVDNLTDKHISDVFKLVADGRTAKESLPEVLTWLSENPDEDGETALRTLGLGMMNSEELDKIIKKIVQEKLNMLKEKGMGAFGPLMGIAMSQVRGKANPKEVQNVLQKYIKENI